MSRGEKIAVVLTAVLLAALVVFLCVTERGGGPYSLSAMPEPTPQALPETPSSTGLLDLNTATAEELAQLPGIGEVRAERIVAYREQNGPFRYVEDVMDVYGIGEGLFAKFRDAVAVYPD